MRFTRFTTLCLLLTLATSLHTAGAAPAVQSQKPATKPAAQTTGTTAGLQHIGQTHGTANLPDIPPDLADSAYPDMIAAMAPPEQRTDRLMVRWPGIIYANAVVVLMYHDVEPFVPSALPATISTKQMKDHLQYLHDAGYNVITQKQFEAFVLEGAPVPYNAVLITFDDGYRTVYSFAYPLLKEMNMPATSFIIVANTEHTNTTAHRPTLEWSQLKEMEQSGLVTVEPHAYFGHSYVRVFPSQQQRPWYLAYLYDPATHRIEGEKAYKARITSDFAKARTAIESHLGGDRISLAYPYGARNEKTDAAADAAGIKVTFTVRAGIVTRGTDRHQLPRVNGGSPAVTVAALDKAIRQVVMGKRFTEFDLPAIRQLQRGARIIKLEHCCRSGPMTQPLP